MYYIRIDIYRKPNACLLYAQRLEGRERILPFESKTGTYGSSSTFDTCTSRAERSELRDARACVGRGRSVIADGPVVGRVRRARITGCVVRVGVSAGVLRIGLGVPGVARGIATRRIERRRVLADPEVLYLDRSLLPRIRSE